MLPKGVAKRVGIAITAVIIVALVVFASLHTRPTLAGLSFAGIDNKGLTVVELRRALEALNNNLPDRRLMLRWNDRQWDLMGKDIGACLDVDDTIARALRERRKRGIWWRMRALLGTVDTIPLDYTIEVDEKRLDEFVDRVAGEIFLPPRNASIDHHSAELLPGRPGRILDVDKTKADILNHLRKWDNGLIQLYVREEQPSVTIQDLEKIEPRYRLARFSTYFDLSEAARVANIELAACKIDGTIVFPDCEFSFNRTVGPRVLRFGFLPAPEIVNNRMVPGIGGGICQVSSTLYNAALLAGLVITERRNHSFPLGYVPLGRDATVYYNLIDFRFRNPYSFPVVISTEIVENRLSVAIFGSRELEADISIETTDIEVIYPKSRVEKASNLAEGEKVVIKKGRQGYRVKVWRRWSVNGETRMEFLSHDLYPAEERVIVVSGAGD